jgi:hypothetical protein
MKGWLAIAIAVVAAGIVAASFLGDLGHWIALLLSGLGVSIVALATGVYTVLTSVGREKTRARFAVVLVLALWVITAGVVMYALGGIASP